MTLPIISRLSDCTRSGGAGSLPASCEAERIRGRELPAPVLQWNPWVSIPRCKEEAGGTASISTDLHTKYSRRSKVEKERSDELTASPGRHEERGFHPHGGR